jgi:hypothetical protein
MRAGTKVLVDGDAGEVWRKSGTDVLVHWYEGPPVVFGPGKHGWPSERTHIEWMPVDSPRLGRLPHSSEIAP